MSKRQSAAEKVLSAHRKAVHEKKKNNAKLEEILAWVKTQKEAGTPQSKKRRASPMAVDDSPEPTRTFSPNPNPTRKAKEPPYYDGKLASELTLCSWSLTCASWQAEMKPCMWTMQSAY